MRCLGCLITVLLLAVQSVVAFDFPLTRSTGTGGTFRLTEPSAAGSLSGAVPPSGGWRVDLGGSSRFSLAELDEFSIAASHGRRNWTGAVGFAQFGDPDLYCERLLKTAVHLSRGRFAIGAAWSSLFCSFGGNYGSLDAHSLGLSGGFSIPNFAASLVIDNLNEPSLSEQAPSYDRTYTLSMELTGRGDFSLMGRIRLEEDTRPDFGFGQVLDILDQASIYWGISSEPLTYGAGIDIMHRGWRLTFAASYHPTLGVTQAVSVVFQTYQAEQE